MEVAQLMFLTILAVCALGYLIYLVYTFNFNDSTKSQVKHMLSIVFTVVAFLIMMMTIITIIYN